MIERYPVNGSLPSEVSTAASQLLQYLRFPVFSWSWWWRRMLFFAPLAFVIAMANGNGHGELARSALQGLAVAWHVAVVSAWFVGGGALLAVLVRHARLGLAIERMLIVLAICTGFAVSELADRWSNRYHTELMCEHRGQTECPDPVKALDTSALGLFMRFGVPIGLYFAFGGGFAVVSYFKEQYSWREYQQRLERERLQLAKNEADMRLSILQAQIEPHFLFNTLASLRSLVRSEPARAEATIDALVDHLRATLPRLREGASAVQATLGRQVEICRSYLEVMRVRMGPRFTYEIEVANDLHAVPFPALMLMSLVENAIKHGVERKPGPCSIKIVARRVPADAGEVIEVSVADDGAGLREGLSSGVGLANIRSQLALRYGANATLTLQGRDGGGAVAALSIPIAATANT